MKNIFIVEDEKNKGEFFIGKKDGKFFYLNGRMSSGGGSHLEGTFCFVLSRKKE